MTAASLPFDVPSGLLIGGHWVPSGDGATFEVTDPSTGRAIATIADAQPADGLLALDAAADSFATWSRTPARDRGELLRAVFESVHSHADEFAHLITLEMGKPLAESEAEVRYGAEFLRWFSEEAVRIDGHFGQLPEGTGSMVVSRRGVGPSYLVTPWNFPLAMATRKLGPALAAGCTAIVKPAGQTPLTTLFLASLFQKAGAPDGVVNVITTTRSSAVSAQIIADRRLRKLSFTGSTGVGQALLKQAADNVLRTSMELGGNAPFLVFEDADLDTAVDGAMAAKFRNIGQACTAANRFIVQRSVVDEFVTRMEQRVLALKLGPGLDRETTIGPLIDEAAVRKLEQLLTGAVDDGARIVTGGVRGVAGGSFFEPTLVRDVSPASALYREEIFGPVVSVTGFDDEAHAVELANGSEYGLAAYVYTRDLARVHRLIDSIETGMMGVNAGVISNAAAPFGGVKHSGMGREGGAEGIREYLDTKYTFIPAT